MTNRWMIVLCLGCILCCSTGCSNGKKRLDITLEGPWILYVEPQFEHDGHKVSVLIAIAPTLATADTDQMDMNHHHLPQLSTGDGYYITKPDIFCLTFDTVCARKGPRTLTTDHYPVSSILKVPFHADGDHSARWDWVKVGRAGNTVLILPMPDSYSNDGVFPMQFAKKWDPNGVGYSQEQGEYHSIGLHLHYHDGPTTIDLAECDPNNPPSTENCRNNPSDPIRQLTNSGTLRIQMRAPDTEDACDFHVRYAYKYIFQLIKNDFDGDYAVIEPAVWHKETKSYQYDVGCLAKGKDPQATGSGGDQHGSEGPTMTNTSSGSGATKKLEATGTQLLFPTEIDEIIRMFPVVAKDHNAGDIVSAKNAATEAMDLQKTLDHNFPRISQVLRIGGLLAESKSDIERYEMEASTRTQMERLPNLERIKRALAADTVKGGNDCGAPTIMMQ
jgi:hypothetical protein